MAPSIFRSHSAESIDLISDLPQRASYHNKHDYLFLGDRLRWYVRQLWKECLHLRHHILRCQSGEKFVKYHHLRKTMIKPVDNGHGLRNTTT
jgi:hypothetical protein